MTRQMPAKRSEIALRPRERYDQERASGILDNKLTSTTFLLALHLFKPVLHSSKTMATTPGNHSLSENT